MTVVALALIIAMLATTVTAWILPDEPGVLDTAHPLHGALGDIVRNGRIEVRA